MLVFIIRRNDVVGKVQSSTNLQMLINTKWKPDQYCHPNCISDRKKQMII